MQQKAPRGLFNPLAGVLLGIAGLLSVFPTHSSSPPTPAAVVLTQPAPIFTHIPTLALKTAPLHTTPAVFPTAPTLALAQKPTAPASKPPLSTTPPPASFFKSPTSPTSIVTQAQLGAAITDLKSYIAAQKQTDQNAFLQNTAFSSRIDQLSNVTISNATVNGVRGITLADLPTPALQPSVGQSFTVDTGQAVTQGDIVAMAANGKIAKWLGSAGASTAPVTTGFSNTNAPQVITLDATHFIYAYQDNGGIGKLTAIAGFISGTTITFGTSVVFSNSTASLSVGQLASTSPTSFVISYNDNTDGTKTKVIAGSIANDTTLTFGTPVTASNSINLPIMVMLDPTHFVLTYRDSTNSNQTYSAAGSVNTSTNVVTVGTPTLASASINSLLPGNSNGGIATLDSSHFLIVYRDSTSANQITAIAASVSSNAITFGSAVVATTSNQNLASDNWGITGPITLIDSTHFLITFWDSTNGNKLSAIAGFVSGTSLSFGTGVQVSTVNSSVGQNILAFMLDSTHFQLFYVNGTTPTTIAGFLSGTNNLTIQLGTAVTSGSVINNQTYAPINVTTLDSTHFVFSYPDNSASKFKTVVFALSGTNNLTTTAGTAVSVAEAGICNNLYRNSSQTIIDSTHYVITYEPGSCAITSVAATVSGGTNVALGTSVIAANTSSTAATPSAVTYLDSSHYFITYSDNTDANKQKAVAASVNTGTGVVTPGTAVAASNAIQNILSSSAANVSVAIDATHFVTVFNDTNNSGKVSAAIGTRSGSSVTFGATYLLSTSTQLVSTVGLATTTGGFVLAYKDGTNSSKVSVVAATVSGSVITAGTPSFGVAPFVSNPPILTLLDGTHFVITYPDSSTRITSIAGTVSGTTLTFGTAVLASNSTTDISTNLESAAALDATHFVLTYVDNTSNNLVASVVGVISSDTTITFGTPVNTGQVGTPKLTVMDPTHFVLSYIDTTNTLFTQGKLTIVPAFVSGSSIAYGNPVIVSNSNNASFLISGLDATHFVLAYVDATNNFKGTAIIGTLSGTNNLTATMGNLVLFGGPLSTSYAIGASGSDLVLTTLNSNHFALAYVDGSIAGNNVNNVSPAALPIQRLQVLTATVSNSTISLGTPTTLGQMPTGTIYLLWSLPVLDATHAVLLYRDAYNGSKITAAAITAQVSSSGNIIGIAAGSGVDGSTVSVYTSGVATGLSGLTIGSIYYAQTDGTLGLTPTAYQVGLALTSTSLLLKSSDTIANSNTDQFFGDAVFANLFRITESFVGGFKALVFKNQNGDPIASLDEKGNFNIAGMFSPTMGSLDATTTASSTLAFFKDSSDALRAAIAAIGDSVIRFLGEVVEATTGVFENVFAKLVRTDTLCVGSTCITQSQLQTLLDKNGISASPSTDASTMDAASSTTPLGQSEASTTEASSTSSEPDANSATSTTSAASSTLGAFFNPIIEPTSIGAGTSTASN